jgi:hypothetical protein
MRPRDSCPKRMKGRQGESVMDKIRTVLPHHLPGYEVRSITRLGEGLDYAAYEVNGLFLLEVGVSEPLPR